MLDVRDAWHAVGQRSQVRRAARRFEFAFAMQFVSQGDQVDGLLALAQRDHVRKYALVLVKEEIFRAQRFQGRIQRLIVQQNGAEDGTFGFQIIGQRPFEGGVSRHKMVRYIVRFIFALDSSILSTRFACAQALSASRALLNLVGVGACSYFPPRTSVRIVRAPTVRVNQSFCISLCTTLEMLKKFWRACFHAEKSAVSVVPEYCALVEKYFWKRCALRFFVDGDFDLCGDVAKNLDGHLRLADDFDRLSELHLPLVDLEALRAKSFGDVGGSHGAEHLIVLAGLACKLQRNEIEQLGLLLRCINLRRGLFGQRGTNALDGFQVSFGGFDRELAWQQVISRVTRLHGHYVTAMPQLVDIFLKNDLHFASLSSCVPVSREHPDPQARKRKTPQA